jgi:hypothetical protein
MIESSFLLGVRSRGQLDRAGAEALEIARRIEAGAVWIKQNLNLRPDTPFAGHKHSGFGVENGMQGLLEYTVPQAVSGPVAVGVQDGHARTDATTAAPTPTAEPATWTPSATPTPVSFRLEAPAPPRPRHRGVSCGAVRAGLKVTRSPSTSRFERCGWLLCSFPSRASFYLTFSHVKCVKVIDIAGSKSNLPALQMREGSWRSILSVTPSTGTGPMHWANPAN